MIIQVGLCDDNNFIIVIMCLITMIITILECTCKLARSLCHSLCNCTATFGSQYMMTKVARTTPNIVVYSIVYCYHNNAIMIIFMMTIMAFHDNHYYYAVLYSNFTRLMCIIGNSCILIPSLTFSTSDSIL